MKREELKARGIADGDVDFILNAWHNGQKALLDHQKALLDQVQALTKERDDANLEMKKYQKDGELYVDKKEYERLMNFEKDTLTKAEKEKKVTSLTKLFKEANASDSATKLFIKGTNLDEVELDEKGNIKGGAEILKKTKADYADMFGSGDTGVPQSPDGEGTAPVKQRAKFY